MNLKYFIKKMKHREGIFHKFQLLLSYLTKKNILRNILKNKKYFQKHTQKRKNEIRVYKILNISKFVKINLFFEFGMDI